MTASDTPAARVDHLAMLRALGSRSTRAIAASGAVAAYVCSATAATESTESTSSTQVRTDESNPIPGANRREVTPLDAPIAAAYPTAANKATAQWRVYTDIARDLSGRGEHEEAGKYLRRALKEAVAGFGKDDPHVAAARRDPPERCRREQETARDVSDALVAFGAPLTDEALAAPRARLQHRADRAAPRPAAAGARRTEVLLHAAEPRERRPVLPLFGEARHAAVPAHALGAADAAG